MAIEDVRSFIAVELPPSLKEKLGELQERMKSGRIDALKWVAPESIHITLKFLGSVSVQTLPGITGVMEEAAFGVAPFNVGVRGLGMFPDERRVRVVWAGLEGDISKLATLQKELERGLEPLGFAPENRPFTAHLTLARVREDASTLQREAIARVVRSHSFDGGDLTVKSVSLMKSQLTRQGAIYTQLASVPLEAQ
jgi:2'-5' RNA ligase